MCERSGQSSNSLYVFFNDFELIPRDMTQTDGWDYDPATMTLSFYGSACDRLEDHEVDDLDIVFGCPGPVIE